MSDMGEMNALMAEDEEANAEFSKQLQELLDQTGYEIGGVLAETQVKQASVAAPDIFQMMAAYSFLAYDKASQSFLPSTLNPYFNAAIEQQNNIISSSNIADVSLASGSLGSLFSTMLSDGNAGDVSGVQAQLSSIGASINGLTIDGTLYDFSEEGGVYIEIDDNVSSGAPWTSRTIVYSSLGTPEEVTQNNSDGTSMQTSIDGNTGSYYQVVYSGLNESGDVRRRMVREYDAKLGVYATTDLEGSSGGVQESPLQNIKDNAEELNVLSPEAGGNDPTFSFDPPLEQALKKALEKYVAPQHSPLIINLSGTGLAPTTSIALGTQFDLQNTGFAELTGWAGPGSGILVNDPTDAPITNGSQLFGTSTSLSGGGYAVDGFAALADLDSNHDGVINSSDTAWSGLRVWVDSNLNGVTDSGELETLSAAGISSISLTTTATNQTDEFGNYHGNTSTYSITGGGTGEIDDVWFQTDPGLTTPDTTVTLDGTISLLPDVQGYGTVTGLQQAMQIQVNASSTTLEGYVQSFVSASDDATRNTLVDEIIYQWTGVEGVSSTARGTYFDARQLEALEKFGGQSFVDPYNSTSDPGSQSVSVLTAAYQQLHNYVVAELESQTDLKSLFTDLQAGYDSGVGTYYWDFSAAETEILSDLSANRASGLATLADFNQALHVLGLDQDEGFATFRSDLAAQGTDVAATFLYGTRFVTDTAGVDVITAWADSIQTVTAYNGGHDTLIAMGDAKLLEGGGDGDLFIGGVGSNEQFFGNSNANPALGGVAGNRDTFIAGQGTELFRENWNGNVTAYYAAGDGGIEVDNFNDYQNGNTMILDSSIAESDVTMPNSLGYFILTDGVSGDTLTLHNVATLQFADGETISLLTSGGIQHATANATLTGGRWDEIYEYNSGTGHVTLSDTGGNNQIWMGPGITSADITLTPSSNDLLITDGVTGDQITDLKRGVQTIRFDDGTTMSIFAAGSTYTLSGGTTATGTALNDTYSFASGTGTATISDPGGSNTIKFGSGITAASLTFTGSGNDLLITDGVSGDQIVVLGQLGGNPVVQTALFSDSSTLNLATGLALHEVSGGSVLNGTTGNDTLFGNSGSQTLNGNGGNDIFVAGSGTTTINGGVGNDTYSFASGSGKMIVAETGGLNTIVLGTSITTGNVSLTASGHDLLITDGVAGDTITISGQLDAQIEVSSLVFTTGGTTESLEGIALSAPSGTSTLNGTPGNDTLTATTGTQTLIGNGGNDTFIGATGTESLVGNAFGGNNIFIDGTGPTTAYGGDGNDTYSYASGDGLLTINETGGQNTLKLAAGLTAASLTFTASGSDLLITDGTGGDTITLKNQLTADQQVQTILFSDASTENLEGIALTMPGGTSLLYGTSGNDTLTATSGTETINGNGGNDIFIDAGGTLTAIGGTGNDTYSYASGSGKLIIQDNAGTNTLVLGTSITTGNVSLAASGHDLLITDGVAGDTITLKNQLSNQYGVTSMVFTTGGSTQNLESVNFTLGAGTAILYGTPGNDTLTASSGTQSLTGNGGNDKFVGTGGAVTMTGGSGNDSFVGGTGSERMIGGGGNDTFQNSGGIDTMTGGAGNDTFIGGSGTETMTGGGGNDIFIAGSGGTATALGNTGNDLYSYAASDGLLTINEGNHGGTDTLKLASGLTSSNVSLTETNGNDLLITDGTGGDLITIVNQLANAASSVETLIYGDASSISLVNGIKITATSGTATVTGTAGNDTLIATSGTQILTGKGGSDTFIGGTGTQTLDGSTGSGANIFVAGIGATSAKGGAGNDLYSYAASDGLLTINEGNHGGTDTLKLASGLTSSNVSFGETNGNDLLITDGTGGDLITIVNQLANAASSVETLIYGDASSISLVNGIKITATSGTATVTGTAGNDTLIATSGTQTLTGNGGSDTFIGSTGTQTLDGSTGSGANIFIAGVGATSAKGGAGNDLYSYAASDGLLTINDTGGTDTLKLASGLTAANVAFSESTNGHDLLITDGTGGDLITISSDINNSADRIETLIYGDNSTLTMANGLTLTAQTGSSTLVGYAGNNTLIAVSGAATETLMGSTGNDIYSYASGTGKVVISDTGGSDTLKLGTGLTAANVVYTESSNGQDLLITDGVTGDTITLKNEVRSGSTQIETFLYGDGTTANLSSIVLTAAAGNTTLNGTSGNNILVGTTGNQTINGQGGSDFFNGGTGTQTLNGSTGGGNNIFFAGIGTTSAKGGTGNDTYNYASGDGALVILDTGGTDTLILGSGLTAANVVYSESSDGGDLLITDGTSGDLITVSGDITYSGERIENLVYGDGSTQNLTTGMTFVAQSGNSTLTGISGGTFTFVAVASSGTETLEGHSGNDTYSYASGDGNVAILQTASYSGTDMLRLGTGLTASNVSFSESTDGFELLITDGVSGDLIDIKKQTPAGAYSVEDLVYGDGTTISLFNGLKITAPSGSTTLDGTAGNDTLIAGSGTQTLNGEGGSDTLIGGTGTQTLNGSSGAGNNIFIDGIGTILARGGTGNDTYSYASGDGALVIYDIGGTDTLILGSGLTAANVVYSESSDGGDLLITDGTGGDLITVTGDITYSGDRIETLVYGDSTTQNLTTGVTFVAQSGNSTLNAIAGGAFTFIAVAGTGTETIQGNTGNDTYSYAAGDGAVYINEGNHASSADTLKLASGLTASNVFFAEASNGADLLITDGTTGDLITIKNAVNSAGYKVETLVYGDSSTLDLTKVIGAGSSATTLNGTTGNDIMIPNTGNLTLAGKGGNDLYDFGRGMGKDYINNGVSTTNSANGTLFFGHGIGDNQLWFDRVDNGGTISASGNNLRIDIMGTTSSMTVNGWYIGGSSTYEQLSEFELSDNGLKLDSQLANLVSAMATFETNYKNAHGGTPFDPTSVSSITDTTVLAAVNSDWA